MSWVVVSEVDSQLLHNSIAVRDLSSIVQPDDIVSSDHLTTLLVVIGKYSQKEWLSSYESLSTFVVRAALELSKTASFP